MSFIKTKSRILQHTFSIYVFVQKLLLVFKQMHSYLYLVQTFNFFIETNVLFFNIWGSSLTYRGPAAARLLLWVDDLFAVDGPGAWRRKHNVSLNRTNLPASQQVSHKPLALQHPIFHNVRSTVSLHLFALASRFHLRRFSRKLESKTYRP